MLSSVVFKFVNFFVLLLIVYKFAKRPMASYLLRRHTDIKEKLEDAERKMREAEERKREYEEKIKKLDEEVENFKREAREEVEAEKKRILKEVNDYIDGLRKQVQLSYEQEVKEMEERIRKEILRRTLENAQNIIKEKINEEDHRRMVGEFMNYLRSLN